MPGNEEPTQSSNFLRWLTEPEASDLEHLSQRRTFLRGDVIFWERDPSQDVMVVRSGRVKVCSRRSGREVIMAVLDPGALLGEVAAADGQPHSATVVALEDVAVDVLSVGSFEEFLTANPRVSATLLRLAAGRLRNASERQVEFGSSDTVTRVCTLLDRLGSRYGTEVEGSLEISAPLSQQELADWSGMSREAFVKALSRLRKLGWIAVGNHKIVLLDPASVARRAS
ncbi:MAG: Crp/Fnr family transcriptional regulator [Acidimicrobiales bacterium]